MFKSLVNVVSEQCQEIKQALTYFPYFETWEADLIAECCRVSSIAEFPPDKIILGPNTGNSHTVYFILEGVCKMVQNLHVEVKLDSRQRTLYKLHRFSDPKNSNSDTKNEGFSSKLFNQRHDFQRGEEAANTILKRGLSEEKVKETEGRPINKDYGAQSDESNNKATFFDNVTVSDKHQNQKGILTNEGIFKKAEEDSKRDQTQDSQSGLLEQEPEKTATTKTLVTEREISYEPDHHLKILQDCKKSRNKMLRDCKIMSPPKKSKNVKSIFLQTGFLFRGTCFGLEKSEKDNFIMSATRVKCLGIPQRFLFKHNPCNVWNRIRLFYSLYLPKDEKIFQYFQSDRKWTERKKKQTEEIVCLKNIPNFTLTCEVPYSIRLAHVG